MIIIGLILLILGFVLGISLLYVLGAVLLIIGLVLLLTGAGGTTAAGGRRYWY